MIINYVRSYPKLTESGHKKLDSKGEPITVFVYAVTGDADEIARYGKIMSEAGHTWKEGDTVLWFTTNPVGEEGTLCISPKGKVYPDTSLIDMCNALIKKYGEVGRDMARELRQKGLADRPKVGTVAEPDLGE